MNARPDSADFNPYRKWLAIRSSEIPPNHYRLLGIDLFETDADIIAVAADRQMAHVRRYQNGEHSAWSQKILNEIASAKLCLLDPQQRDAYAEQLQAKMKQQRIQAKRTGQFGAPPNSATSPDSVNDDRPHRSSRPTSPSNTVDAQPFASREPLKIERKTTDWFGPLIALVFITLAAGIVTWSAQRGQLTLPKPTQPLTASPPPTEAKTVESDAASSPNFRTNPPTDSATQPTARSTPRSQGSTEAGSQKPADSESAHSADSDSAESDSGVSTDNSPTTVANRDAADTAGAVDSTRSTRPPGIETDDAVDDTKTAQRKLPVPNEQDVAAVVDQLQSDPEFQNAKACLAGAIQASETDVQFVLLKRAIKLGLEEGEYRAAWAARILIFDHYDLPAAIPPETVFFQTALKHLDSQPPAAHLELIEIGEESIQTHLDHDAYDAAIELLEVMVPITKRSRSVSKMQQSAVRKTLTEARKLKGEFERLRPSRDQLLKNPQDPLANTRVGEFYCYQKHDFQRGLPFLAKGKDAQTREVASEDLQAKMPLGRLAVARDWKNLSEQEGRVARIAINDHVRQQLHDVLSYLRSTPSQVLQRAIDSARLTTRPAANILQDSPAYLVAWEPRSGSRFVANLQLHANGTFSIRQKSTSQRGTWQLAGDTIRCRTAEKNGPYREYQLTTSQTLSGHSWSTTPKRQSEPPEYHGIGIRISNRLTSLVDQDSDHNSGATSN